MSEQEVFLVTGASKGLGKSIAQQLAKQGYTVIGLARDSQDLSDLDNQLKSLDSKSQSIICDLANQTQVREVAQEIIHRFPAIHGIIHNAGIIGPIGSMFSVEELSWNKAISVNLLSVQLLTQILYPAMVNAQRCRVTTISSGAAINSLESWSAYCTSKAGLDMWTRCLADEGSARGISAISVAPGIVDTDMQANIRSSAKADFPMVDRFVKFFENGDLVSPDDVASSLLNLVTSHTMQQSGSRFDVRDL